METETGPGAREGATRSEAEKRMDRELKNKEIRPRVDARKGGDKSSGGSRRKRGGARKSLRQEGWGALGTIWGSAKSSQQVESSRLSPSAWYGRRSRPRGRGGG